MDPQGVLLAPASTTGLERITQAPSPGSTPAPPGPENTGGPILTNIQSENLPSSGAAGPVPSDGPDDPSVRSSTAKAGSPSDGGNVDGALGSILGGLASNSQATEDTPSPSAGGQEATGGANIDPSQASDPGGSHSIAGSGTSDPDSGTDHSNPNSGSEPKSPGTDVPSEVPHAVTVGGVAVSAAPIDPGSSSQNAGVVIGSQPLSVGATTVISNTPVSIATNGVVIGDSGHGGATISLAPASAPAPAAAFGDVTFSAASGSAALGNVVLDGNTLAPGQTTILHQTYISVGSSGIYVAGPTESFTLPLPTASAGYSESDSPSVDDGLAISVDPSNSKAVVVGGHTLSVSQATVIGGTQISVGSGGVIISDPSGQVSTVPFPAAAQSTVGQGEPTDVVANSGAIVTLGSSAQTAVQSNGAVVIGSVTLTPGGAAVTISGTVFSAGSSGLAVDGTSTISFSRISKIDASSNGRIETSSGDLSTTGVAGSTGSAAKPSTKKSVGDYKRSHRASTLR